MTCPPFGRCGRDTRAPCVHYQTHSKGIHGNRGRAKSQVLWVAVVIAGRSGRKVEATPLEGNPRHADIILPSTAEELDEQRRRAQELRDLSTWRPRTD